MEKIKQLTSQLMFTTKSGHIFYMIFFGRNNSIIYITKVYTRVCRGCATILQQVADTVKRVWTPNTSIRRTAVSRKADCGQEIIRWTLLQFDPYRISDSWCAVSQKIPKQVSAVPEVAKLTKPVCKLVVLSVGMPYNSRAIQRLEKVPAVINNRRTMNIRVT